MIKLFDSPISPFARKVRMVLEHKGLEYETIDGLRKSHHELLKSVNGRVEVPVLVDKDVTVVNSADIVNYLEYQYQQVPVYPGSAAARVRSRAWERAADTFIDPILINVSYWKWANRKDSLPDKLLEAARTDMKLVYDRLECDLTGKEFVCGQLSIADIALFPHFSGVKALNVEFSTNEHPNIAGWFKRMRTLPMCADDVQRARDYFSNLKRLDVETNRIFWRGDRIEWMLSRGFHGWFMKEIADNRVLWPGAALPTPME